MTVVKPPRTNAPLQERKWREEVSRAIASPGGPRVETFVTVTGPYGSLPSARVLAGTAGNVELNDGGAGANLEIDLSDTGVIAGTYGSSTEIPVIAVDDKGRVISASSLPVASSGGNSVTATVNFGASFTDKASTVVTGQTWVASGSEIVPQIKCPSGVDPDEMRLLDFKIVISDLVVGTGFTVTVYSEPEAKGTYDVMCIGV